MNAIKSFSAAVLAIGTIATFATTPVTVNASVLDTLDRIESQSAHWEPNLRSNITRSNKSILDTLNRLEEQGTSKESGITPKVNRPAFLEELAERATSKESGI